MRNCSNSVPVTFRYKEGDGKGKQPLQYGLIAEEVAKVFPDLVQYDKQGKPFTVFYHLLTPMLLNQLQKEHRNTVSVTSTQNMKIAGLVAQNKTLVAENVSMKAELASLKQAQAEQQKLLVKLAAYVQNGKNNAPIQKVNVVQH